MFKTPSPLPYGCSLKVDICVFTVSNDCVTYPFEGPPNARSNTWIGFNNCLNFLTNLTP